MVSDFVEAHSGFLLLTETEHDLAKAANPNFPKTARVLLEYDADLTIVLLRPTDLTVD